MRSKGELAILSLWCCSPLTVLAAVEEALLTLSILKRAGWISGVLGFRIFHCQVHTHSIRFG